MFERHRARHRAPQRVVDRTRSFPAFSGRNAWRSALFSACTTLLLWGCPGYGDSENCVRDAQCAPGYACDTEAGRCVGNPTVPCDRPLDCDEPMTCGSDGTCQVGDCTWPDIGCVAGFECAAADGIWACVAEGSGSADGGAGGGLTAGEAGSASLPTQAGAGGTSGG
jgi:hypothetical protein